MSDVAALGSSRAGSKGSGDPDEIVQQVDGQAPRIGSPKRKPAAATTPAPMESNLNGTPLNTSDPRLAKLPNGTDKREKEPKRSNTAPPRREEPKRQSGAAQNGKDDHSGGGTRTLNNSEKNFLCPKIFAPCISYSVVLDYLPERLIFFYLL